MKTDKANLVIEKHKDTFFFVSLCFMVLILPLFNNLTPIGIAIISLAFIFDVYNLKDNFLAVFRKRDNLFPIVLYLLAILSLIYTSDFEQGAKYIGKLIPFLSLPIVLVKVKDLSSKQLHILFKLYIYGCLLACFWAMGDFIIETSSGKFKEIHHPDNWFNYFANRITYHEMIENTSIGHAGYFSLYLAIAVFLCFYEWLRSKKRRYIYLLIFFIFFLVLLHALMINIALYTCIVLFFTVFKDSYFDFKKKYLYLLIVSFAGGFICSYLLINKIIPHPNYIYLFENKNYNLFLITAPIITSIFSYFLVKNQWLYNKKFVFGTSFLVLLFVFYVVYSNFFYVDDKSISNLEARTVNWRASLILIKDNMLFGLGIGDVQNELTKKYLEMDFEKLSYNEHNQYLRFWLQSGIVSLIIFIFWMFQFLKNSIKKKNYLLFGLVLMVSFFSFSESVFARQYGIIFIIFFMYLLNNRELYSDFKNDSINN
ncbi:hypothetical protein GTQ40_11665 [Flavobacteriaceae bacterium R38]|nr:hypothetical protein [Flavobacteriaceae bacterium R38]